MDTVNDHMGKNGFVWFHGVVEDTNDPLQIGRVRVRCLEFHTDDKTDIPTESLPWAIVLMPNTSASVSGKGISPGGLLQGSWVIGFFRDGVNAQDPVVLGSFHGMPSADTVTDKLSNPIYGYSDPLGIYPSEEYRDESDVNRLCRNDENLKYTVVPGKIKTALVSVKTAFGSSSWTEPISQYAPIYPHNKVMETESGHIVEFDDTKGAERIHIRHTAGTWIEIHPDGSVVSKIVGTENNIKLKDSNTLINGSQNTNINGSQRVRISKDGLIEISGDAKILVNGNTIMETKKDFVHKVGGNYTIASGGKMLFVGSRIDFNPEGVSPGSVSVNLPASKETVAKSEYITPKNKDASPYQITPPVEEETEDAAIPEVSVVSMGAVSEISTISTEANPENFVEVAGETMNTSVVSEVSGLQTTQNQIVDSSGTVSVNNSAVGLSTEQTTPTVMSSIGGIATGLVAGAGVAMAAVSLLGSSSSSTTTTTQYPQPISPVVLPAGAQTVDTRAPGIPTQSFYAVPGATATLIAGYPGLSSPNLSTSGTSIGSVSSIPAVPLVGFETEFPQQAADVVTDIDGGEF